MSNPCLNPLTRNSVSLVSYSDSSNNFSSSSTLTGVIMLFRSAFCLICLLIESSSWFVPKTKYKLKPFFLTQTNSEILASLISTFPFCPCIHNAHLLCNRNCPMIYLISFHGSHSVAHYLD